MDVFSLFTFAGGLGLFLFGMSVLGEAIARQAGGPMKRTLETITSNRVMGVLLGTVVAAVIQSSSATSVMISGFVNSGIMTLENAVGPIIGANVGTTATGWLLAMSDISGTSLILRLLNPDSFVPVLAFLGAVLLVFGKRDRLKDAGIILLGFSVLMFGMSAMSDAMSPLRSSPVFRQILSAMDHPILGLLAGFAMAAVLQSSSASVGILQAAAGTGVITIANALPLILGINIGAGLIVILSAAGKNRDTLRTAWIYMFYNIIGAVIFTILLVLLELLSPAAYLYTPINAFNIALLHTAYKIVNSALQLPFARQLIWLTNRVIRSKPSEERFELLDENFLRTPPIAVARCSELTDEMAQLTLDSLHKAVGVLRSFDADAAREVRGLEDHIDGYEDKLGGFLVKLSSTKLSMADTRETGKLLHCLSDFERISDLAVNLVESAEELQTLDPGFSEAGQRDLDVMLRAVEEVGDLAVHAFAEEHEGDAERVEPLEELVDQLCQDLRARHIERLLEGKCGTVQGYVFTDILTALERISDHCTNVATVVLEMHRSEYEPHTFEKIIKQDDPVFRTLFKEYSKKYALE